MRRRVARSFGVWKYPAECLINLFRAGTEPVGTPVWGECTAHSTSPLASWRLSVLALNLNKRMTENQICKVIVDAAIEVHGNDRAGARRDRALERIRIHVVVVAHVDEHRARSGVDDGRNRRI